MPRMVHNSAVELAKPLFRRKRKRGNTGSRSVVGVQLPFSIVGCCYSAGSSRRFSPFFSDRFERRGLVYVGSSIQHKTASDAVFAEYGFTWDAGNRITEFETVDGTAEYTYDKTGQLTGADYDYITDELYTYDDNGNRTNAGYVTGDNNDTLSDGTYRYSYDAEGNRTEKFLWTDTNNDGIIDASEKTLVQTYNWDYRNRLESVTNYENGIAKEVINYLYDYLNLMIERTVTDAATSALQSSDFNIYSNGQVVLEYDTTSSVDVVKSINLWGANIDELVAVEQMAQSVNDSNVILWTYSDHLNSIRDVLIYDSITQTAAVVNHLIYNAFGVLVSSTDGSANPVSISPLLNFRYTGKFFDDSTGLQNNINRWYDNTTGKWISEDPISFWGGDINLYRYEDNSTIHYTDFSGLFSQAFIPRIVHNDNEFFNSLRFSNGNLTLQEYRIATFYYIEAINALLNARNLINQNQADCCFNKFYYEESNYGKKYLNFKQKQLVLNYIQNILDRLKKHKITFEKKELLNANAAVEIKFSAITNKPIFSEKLFFNKNLFIPPKNEYEMKRYLFMRLELTSIIIHELSHIYATSPINEEQRIGLLDFVLWDYNLNKLVPAMPMRDKIIEYTSPRSKYDYKTIEGKLEDAETFSLFVMCLNGVNNEEFPDIVRKNIDKQILNNH